MNLYEQAAAGVRSSILLKLKSCELLLAQALYRKKKATTMQVNELKHGRPLRKCDWDGNWEGISSRFFENQPNEICSHLCENALKPEKLQSHSNEKKGEGEKKERGEGKEEKKKKNNGCSLSFYISFFGDRFWPKKLLDTKGPFGHNVIKNPARYIDVKSHFKISRANVW